MDPFIGQIVMFGGNFAPRGWAFCDGQLLPISQYSALFSILGTIYGGDGRTTFALPDLRGRAPIHKGQGPGLGDYRLGQKGGSEQVTLTTEQIPSHDHPAHAARARADAKDPTGNLLAGSRDQARFVAPGTNEVEMADSAIGAAGGSQAHANLPPYLAVSYIIALQGVFPSRS